MERDEDRKHRCIVVAGTGAGACPATALDPHTCITQYSHTAWRVQDGAFGAAPGAITQTSDGYVWIGTGSGLVKYDGVRFEPWTPRPGKSLPDPTVISLRGASDGTLWIRTARGLVSWKNNDLREHLEYRINGIIEDHKGRIWVARARVAAGGLCEVTGERPGCFGADDRMKLLNAGSLALYRVRVHQVAREIVPPAESIVKPACTTFWGSGPETITEN